MIVFSNPTIQFNLYKSEAVLQLTTKRSFRISKDTLLAHAFTTGYRGYSIFDKVNGEIITPQFFLSVRVARKVIKYFKTIPESSGTG